MQTFISAFLVLSTFLAASVQAQPAGEKKNGLTRGEVDAILKKAALSDRHEKILRQYIDSLPKGVSKDRIEDLRRVLKQ